MSNNIEEENYNTGMSVMAEKMSNFEKRFDRFEDRVLKSITGLRKELENKYVTQDEFKIVRMVTYGMVGIIMTTVLAALLRNVVI